MKVDEVIQRAAAMLELFPAGGGELGDSAGRISEEDEKKLLVCLDNVNEETAREYLRLVREEEIESESGSLNPGDFSRAPVFIISVLKKDGGFKRKLRFTRQGESVAAEEGGRLSVTYAYLPEKAKTGGEAENLSGVRTAALGVCAEYCLIENRPDEAVMWDKRYRDSLRRRQPQNYRIAGRKWE